MKKLFMVVFVALLMGLIAIPASADSINLIQNSSFEDFTWDPLNFDYWRESASGVYLGGGGRTGTYSAALRVEGTSGSAGLVSNRFDITELGTYEYGAWFRFRTDVDPATLTSWPYDRPGVTASIRIGDTWSHDATIVNISSYLATTWTESAGYWTSDDWFLIAGTFEVAQICQGELNIYIQEYNNAVWSLAFVDDAYVRQAPVPEPATLMLLGTGLIGLAGLRRKFKK